MTVIANYKKINKTTFLPNWDTRYFNREVFYKEPLAKVILSNISKYKALLAVSFLLLFQFSLYDGNISYYWSF